MNDWGNTCVILCLYVCVCKNYFMDITRLFDGENFNKKNWYNILGNNGITLITIWHLILYKNTMSRTYFRISGNLFF